jgi:ABC-type Fe3+/spermidine/putrescine transport system ATPase subunit
VADHLIVLDDGLILQSGPVEDVFSRPSDERVARMVGVETIQPGRVVGRSNGTVTVEIGGTKFTAMANGNIDEEVLVCIRADEVEITPDTVSPAASPNRLVATISKSSPDGATARLEFDCGFRLAAIVTRQAARSLNLGLGNVVTVHLPTAAVHLMAQTSRKDAPS